MSKASRTVNSNRISMENTIDRYRMSQFYKGKESEIEYIAVQQLDNKNLDTENLHIQSLSFLYDTLNTKGRSEIEKKWIAILPQLAAVKRIKISCGMGQELFDAVCQIPNLQELLVESSKVSDLSKLARAKNLKRLEIDSFSQLRDIDVLEKINLHHLRIENCFNIQSYAPIGKIKSLVGLALNGNRWTPKNLRLESMVLFTQLKNLRHLDLAVVALRDKNSISAILQMEKLERFDYTGSLKAETVKNIIKAHPKLKAGLFVDWNPEKEEIQEGKFW